MHRASQPLIVEVKGSCHLSKPLKCINNITFPYIHPPKMGAAKVVQVVLTYRRDMVSYSDSEVMYFDSEKHECHFKINDRLFLNFVCSFLYRVYMQTFVFNVH